MSKARTTLILTIIVGFSVVPADSQQTFSLVDFEDAGYSVIVNTGKDPVEPLDEPKPNPAPREVWGPTMIVRIRPERLTRKHRRVSGLARTH